jgi:phenylalanine-4-hydroxylase
VSSAAAAPAAPAPEKVAPKADAWSSTRIPQSIHEISNGENILGFGANLAADHPGYNDEEYKRRRMQIVEIAKQHVPGQPVPYVDYSPAETAVWGEVLTKLEKLYPSFACQQFLDTFPLFNFRPDVVPQLQDMSEVLRQRTGWTIRPVAGLLHPRDFLNGLAFRTFHSTQYIRHGSNPMYTPEPDICHELLGHVPMLADPAFADMAYSIGLASLGASKEDCWHLTKLYWYTVEFGVIKEGEQLKAFGAGILSSFGELEWFQHGKGEQKPVFEPLDPFGKLTKMSYKDGFQKKYYVAESFTDLAAKIKEYATYLHNKNKVNSSDLSILQ